MTHHLNILAGQEYRMPVRLVDAAGHAVPIADYDVYGAARRGSETTRMSIAVVDGSSCVVIIPPLEQASYTYDLYLRHRLTTAEVQILAGNIAVRGRVASMPPVTGGGEDVVAVVSADMTEVQVTVTPIAVATPDAWDRLDRAGDLLAEAIETAGALVPDAQRIIRQEVETGQSTIKAASADAVRQAGADIAGAGDREVASAADRIRAVSGEEANAIAAAGDAARQAVASAGSSTTSDALAAIDAATDTGERAIGSSINSGVNAIGQSITAGTSEIQAATTAGTGTITDKVTASMQLLDGYVGTVSDDLARKSQPNIWSGVHTFNAAAILNGGGIVSTSTPLGADPLADQQRITGLLDGQQLQAMYGGRPLPLTYETHATDAYYDGSKRAGYAFMYGKISALGAWRSAWLTSQQSISGNMWVNVPTATGGARRQTARTGTYAVNILPAASNADSATSPPPVVVGLNTFFTGHSAGDALPPTKRPWDPHIIQQPHHANWNQPKAVVCCEAYGHKIATLHIYVGYGSSVTDKDVSPAVIRYNCIPCIRYKSPIANVSTITAFYFSSDSNGQGYYEGTTRTYIQTCDGQLVSVIGTPLDQRHSSVGMLAISRAGTQAAACVRDVTHYPNVRPASYYANSVQYHNPVHPVETWLENNVTHKIQRPAKPLKEKISIAYAAAAPEEYPCDIYSANITGGVMSPQTYGNYGSQLHIAAAAQDMQITCPAGWVIDVDDWSTDWCVLEGNTLHILPNDTGSVRYVSVWVYAPNNTNTTDGTNVVWEYGINQAAN